MKNNRKYAILVPLWASLILVSFIFIRKTGIGFQEIVDYTPGNHFLAALLIIALYTIRVILWVFPMAIVHVASGLLFPLPWGLIVSYMGMFVEMTVGYFMGRRMGQEKVKELVQEHSKARSFFETLKDNGPAACLVCRILPLPYDITSMFFGASGMPLAKYLVFSLLGASPGMIPYVIAGGTIDDPLSKEFLIPVGISVGIALGSLIVFQVIQKRVKPRNNSLSV